MMNPVNYAEMSDRELKQYFLAHRQEEEAFQAFLVRLRNHPRKPIAKVGDPDFDEKIQAAIQQQIQAHKAQQDSQN
jgi:hypothetical protein